MATTRNAEEYRVFVFQMAICVAHEITHTLTGFLTGSARPPSPPTVAVPGMNKGEAGRWWELEALGGISEFYAKPNDRRNANQAGTPYIFDDMRLASPGVKISKAYLEHFELGSKRSTLFFWHMKALSDTYVLDVRLPVERSRQDPQPTTRNAIRQRTTEMTLLRENLNGSTTAAINDYPPGGSVRYRSPIYAPVENPQQALYYPAQSSQGAQSSQSYGYGSGDPYRSSDPYGQYQQNRWTR